MPAAQLVLRVLAIVQFVATFLLFTKAFLSVGPPPGHLVPLVFVLLFGVPGVLWLVGEWLQ